MKYNDIAKDVGDKTGLDEETIKLIYKKLFVFMREKLHGVDVKLIDSLQNLIDSKASFNLLHLGKFYLNYNIIKKNKRNNEDTGNTTDVQQHSDDC